MKTTITSANELVRLNLGCGSVRPEGWYNIDSSLNAHLQRLPFFGKAMAKVFNKVEYDSKNVLYMDLRGKWKFDNDSVDIIYASHLLEHLPLAAAKSFLKQSFRCLKPGGVLRLVVPDLYKICKKYTNDYETSGSEDPTEFIMWAINMHREGQYGNKLSLMKKIVFEWQGYPHQHKFMYDEKSLSKHIREAGFERVLSLSYGVSEYIPSITDVEGAKESYLSVYLEAKKPVA